jgi:hypothetical protein
VLAVSFALAGFWAHERALKRELDEAITARDAAIRLLDDHLYCPGSGIVKKRQHYYRKIG